MIKSESMESHRNYDGRDHRRGGDRGRGRAGNDWNQQGQGRDGGRGRSDSRSGFTNQAPIQQQRTIRPQAPGGSGASEGFRRQPAPVPSGGPSGYVPQNSTQQQQGVGPSSGRGGVWTGRPWGPPAAPSSDFQPQRGQSSTDNLDIGALRISEHVENRNLPFRSPDEGVKRGVQRVNLLVNHFPVHYDSGVIIMHYDVNVEHAASDENPKVKKKVLKSDIRLVCDKWFSVNIVGRDKDRMAYDGVKNIFSLAPLPIGEFVVDLKNGENIKGRSYKLTIKLVSELRLSELDDYLSRKIPDTPRNILQAMDLVMKDNPIRNCISAGRGFYSRTVWHELGRGVAAHEGFTQSLKLTSQGVVLCLDYSVIAFRKCLPVMDYLKEHIRGFSQSRDVKRLKKEVINALRGLKVTVNHRETNQIYTIARLTDEDAGDISFSLVAQEGKPTEEVSIVKYFKDKWGKDVLFKDIPCLDLSRTNRPNIVPIEFCVLAEGQRYPMEQLGKDARRILREKSLLSPQERKDKIDRIVRSGVGPCGDVMRGFGMEVDPNMTKVQGHVMAAPDLKLHTNSKHGGHCVVKVDREKRNWTVKNWLVDAKLLNDGWAVIDFSGGMPEERDFIYKLREKARNFGIIMKDPLVKRRTRMNQLFSVDSVNDLLGSVMDEFRRKNKGRLLLIICVMSEMVDGYKYLKWVSETGIGVVTQCCLVEKTEPRSRGLDQYLSNLFLNINGKLGGSNTELNKRLPHFKDEDHVMFIGADVNHPAPRNVSCPSIAAVVGSINWPAATRYAARICPQKHRQEEIEHFGTMSLDLIKTYTEQNGVRPNSIVIFRDGVSDGQFKMVLDKELERLEKAIAEYDESYKPKLTVVVAQKRHQTRLFLQNEREGGKSGNVPPGTVVDSNVVQPFADNFFHCSHYGSIGTSKAPHYYLLKDDNSFTLGQMEELVYQLCFTYAACTKPISVVPPVYYADKVAFRGRLYQEVAMERDRSFDQSLYDIHPNLKNSMFYI